MTMDATNTPDFGLPDEYSVRIGRLMASLSSLDLMLEFLIRVVTGLSEHDTQILISHMPLIEKRDRLHKLYCCRDKKLLPGIREEWRTAHSLIGNINETRKWMAHGFLT